MLLRSRVLSGPAIGAYSSGLAGVGARLRWVGQRQATTISSGHAQDHDDDGHSGQEKPFYHKEWPMHKDPSPYDIFGIDQAQFSLKELRAKYYRIAKIYHPDISSNKALIGHDGDILTDEHKSERFKLVTKAYTLLKDSKARADYDRFRLGWLKNDQMGPLNSYTNHDLYTGPPRYKYNEAYWTAGGWQDYHDLRDMSDPSLRPDKFKVLGLIALFVITSASIQGWYVLDKVESSINARQIVHDATEMDLAQAYINYGLDDSKLARIKRFLWFRTFGLYIDKGQLDASAKQNEQLMSEIYNA